MDKIQQIAELEITRYEAMFMNTSLLIGMFYACDSEDVNDKEILQLIEDYKNHLKEMRRVVNPARINLIRRALETLY